MEALSGKWLVNNGSRVQRDLVKRTRKFASVGKQGKRIYLAEWRAYRNLTQEQLESRARVSQSTIWAIENEPEGRRNPGTLAGLADALDTTPEKLYTDPWENPPENGNGNPKPEAAKPSAEISERLKHPFVLDGKTYQLTQDQIDELVEFIKFKRRNG